MVVDQVAKSVFVIDGTVQRQRQRQLLLLRCMAHGMQRDQYDCCLALRVAKKILKI